MGSHHHPWKHPRQPPPKPCQVFPRLEGVPGARRCCRHSPGQARRLPWTAQGGGAGRPAMPGEKIPGDQRLPEHPGCPAPHGGGRLPSPGKAGHPGRTADTAVGPVVLRLVSGPPGGAVALGVRRTLPGSLG
ncbi:cuticle collagen 2C-like [Eriocheir sinensis]|uniref:cuticle collagen 2C-like n=1 Tax=Eriocheir sinensis TaxID=95602 RepID=UPI0021C6187E|nr:cuticle collagen 2C-like [Eriocheir sinensis]